jgi:hypothetical protein
MTTYTKTDLLNDIHELVEKYIEQELTEMLGQEQDAQVIVVSDSEGDDIDMTSGDIWNLQTQNIIGTKDLRTGKKSWFDFVPEEDSFTSEEKEEQKKEQKQEKKKEQKQEKKKEQKQEKKKEQKEEKKEPLDRPKLNPISDQTKRIKKK